MIKNTIAGIKQDCKEILPKLNVIRAKAENKLYKAYFKAFKRQQEKNRLTEEDYKTFCSVCNRFAANIKVIRGA